MLQILQERRRLILTLAIILLSILLALPYVMAIVETAGVLGMTLTDAVFGAPLMPHEPYIMYAICGTFVGLCTGLWLIAPAYGLKKFRKLVVILPIGLLSVLTILSIWRQH